MNWIVEMVGVAAGVCTTGAYLPQALRTLKLRETKDISTSMYIMMTMGVGLWVVYGILLGSPSVIVANAISFILVVSILMMKLRFG